MRKRQADRTKVDECLRYIEKADDYQIMAVLKTHNLLKDMTEKSAGNFVISCPFHPEKTPSFYFSADNGAWHCFSCSRAGYVPHLMFEINKEIERSSASFYQFMNNVLANDITMKSSLGFYSIYKLEETKGYAIYERRVFTPSKEIMVDNYIQLSHVMKKEKLDSKEQLRLAVLYMQNGMPANEILQHLKGLEVTTLEMTDNSFFDISDLLSSE